MLQRRMSRRLLRSAYHFTGLRGLLIDPFIDVGCGKLMLKQSTSSDRYSASSKSAMHGRRNMRYVGERSTAFHCSFHSNCDPTGSTREVAEISSRTGRLGSEHAGSVIVSIYSSDDILTNPLPVTSHLGCLFLSYFGYDHTLRHAIPYAVNEDGVG